ncbi:MAG TPA: type II secretion system F family protein [Mycobacteriales bacterium]|nr:type II secretion system F family protein [Mycobacteriales bacterium]
MGVLVGLCFGIGLLLVCTSGARAPRRRSARRDATLRLLAQADVADVTPAQLLAVQAAAAVIVGLLVLVVTDVRALALAAATAAGLAPRQVLRSRARSRTAALRDAWPDLVDDLASAVRAGLPLPEAIGALAARAPEDSRAAFTAFAADHRATGSFDVCIDRLEDTLADPVADRVGETLRLARAVGGHDVGDVLRTLSAFLRADARTRGEVVARQSWTTNGARLALAAPWAVLALLAAGSAQTVAAYNRPTGALVLLVGGVTSTGAYALMLRLGRLPDEPRLRGRAR